MVTRRKFMGSSAALGGLTLAPGLVLEAHAQSAGDLYEAAKREVAEETGYTFNEWKLLRVWQPQRKFEWFIYVYVAWDVSIVSTPHLDPGERITIDFVTLEHLQKMAGRNEDVIRESYEVLKSALSVADLINLPVYEGKTIDW